MSIFTKATTVDINGKKMKLLDFHKELLPGQPPRLTLELTGEQMSFTNSPSSFEFQGEEWHVTAMSINSSPTGPIVQRIEAISRNIPMTPKSSTPPIPPMANHYPRDPHDGCVPKQHYEGLKSAMVLLMTRYNNGHMILTDDELKEFDEWQILHTEQDNGVTLLALPPEVAIKV